jgi:hypothetical protein
MRFVAVVSSSIANVRDFQPALHFVINVFQRSDLDAMRDPIFLCIAARVYQSLGRISTSNLLILFLRQTEPIA